MRTVSGIVQDTLRQAGEATADTVASLPAAKSIGTWVGAATPIVLTALGAHTIELTLWLLLLMFVDLMSGLLRALRVADQRFEGAILMGGILGKLLRLMLLPVAVALERMMFSAGIDLPGSHTIPLLVVMMLMAGEAASIVQNVQTAEGPIGAAKALSRFIRMWREGAEGKISVTVEGREGPREKGGTTRNDTGNDDGIDNE